MKVQDALDVRRFCEQILRISYPGHGPEYKSMSTVVVDTQFAEYVAALSEQWAEVQSIDWPSMDEAGWPFKGQSVLFIHEKVIDMEFLLIQKDTPDGRRFVPIEPRLDTQPVIALFTLDPAASTAPPTYAVDRTGQRLDIKLPPEQRPQATIHIHPDGTLTDGRLAWGTNLHKQAAHLGMGYCARWERAFVEAAGKRSRLEWPVYETLSRPERRAIERTEVPYRLLRLDTPEMLTIRSTGGGKTHEGSPVKLGEQGRKAE